MSATEQAGASGPGEPGTPRPARADRRAPREGASACGESDPSAFPYSFPGVEPIERILRAPTSTCRPARRPRSATASPGASPARRGAGRAAFLDLVDRTGKIQLHARVDVLGEERLRAPDVARPRRPDRRRRRALCAAAAASSRCAWTRFEVLAKALRPPPDKHHGLTDVETRYRRRELDLIANEETRAGCSSTAPGSSRRCAPTSTSEGFIEVETPVLQPLYGGALARPFTTHHNALDRDLYLRIATELYLKRLHRRRPRARVRARQGLPQRGRLAQAQPRVHDGRVVRGLRRLRRRGARAWKSSCARPPRAVGYAGELDFAAPWRRVELRRGDRRARPGIDVVATATPSSSPAAIARARACEMQIAEGAAGRSSPTTCSPSTSSPACAQPTFVLDYPVELSPFARDAPLASRAWSSAGRRSPAAWRSPTPSAS